MLGDDHQAAERARQSGLGGTEALDGGGIGGIGGGGLRGGQGDVAGLDDIFERAVLVLEVTLGDLDEVRDQVIAALELDIDLREGVLETVAEGDKPVVDADHEQGQHHDGGEEDEEEDEDNAHGGEEGKR